MSPTVSTLMKTTYKVNKYILPNYIYTSSFLPNIVEIGSKLNFVFNFLSYFAYNKEEPVLY